MKKIEVNLSLMEEVDLYRMLTKVRDFYCPIKNKYQLSQVNRINDMIRKFNLFRPEIMNCPIQ